MSILQFETQVSPEGVITLPPIPEYHDRKVIVRIDETDGLWSDPSAVRKFFESRVPLAEELTDEEIEQLKHERRMRKIQ